MILTCECGKIARWMYMPSGDVACDDCVPRGCSCNAELKEGIDWESPAAAKPENYEEPLDERGRKYPCCEWHYNEGGFTEADSPPVVLLNSYLKAVKEGRANEEKDYS